MSTSTTVAELASSTADTTVLDVRTPAEYASGHIPGSYSVPLARLDDAVPALSELQSTAGSLVVACATGARSADAVGRLAAAGITAVSLTGGTVEWARTGEELVRSEGAAARPGWAMDRQVRLAAGSLVVLGLLLDFLLPGARYLSLAVGGGLVFSALTNTCGMAVLLSRLPYNRTSPGDTDWAETLERLRAGRSEAG
ncbi:rhodanese-like domain-containing protein [Streptomyces sp. XM4193]|uniref:rhodanese-like domain-containing protein n=1 Tax=Streptomyces sp. XM4193 TaxID=2929782 RepID=UPI001FFA58CD|nr:rhodanese-like domain-containing protein [Streptomyces sp. XM4193]MCK1795752.1 rhodanese-like domain-containing protein [Streptomyces sp. XM4193]